MRTRPPSLSLPLKGGGDKNEHEHPSPSPLEGEGRGGGCRRADYLRDPDEIMRRSFAILRQETDVSKLAPDLAEVALRLVHASGMPDIVADLRASPDAARRGREALAAGRPILCDAEMTAAGVTRRHLPAGNRVVVSLGDLHVPELAQRHRTTRSAAAVELWRPYLAGSVVAIGNAPTALFHLLEMLADGAPPPALILGFPVGFVGAAESKAALAENTSGLGFITLLGRRGGSAMAAAAVNALALGAKAAS
ncbi:MAG: precorrin-8X methylmutase [Proteobacteria bacterium]|nr:precorrin-8X methylmutase [Pseudomonadota bacterium]